MDAEELHALFRTWRIFEVDEESPLGRLDHWRGTAENCRVPERLHRENRLGNLKRSTKTTIKSLRSAKVVRSKGPPLRNDLRLIRSWAGQVMLPGKKQRIEVPNVPFTGHTIVRPARFGSVMTASSGTIIHSPSKRTR
jgi:hypothetical protein